MKFLSALVLAAGVCTLVGAVPKITRTGRYLYADDGTRFFVKGITYQTQGAFSLSLRSSLFGRRARKAKRGKKRKERTLTQEM
jgi:hypothetical protein